MSLAQGAQLGPYLVVAPLGAGGMGEVYRARDTKLGREVAIKLLPEAFAADPERLARLEREARLLASLNHPGIAHLYGFETASLGDGRNGRFLVMELAEGEDLAARMSRGAIPIEEAVGIARQIAEALEEAHEKGIVHRDLKPSNVKLTPEGRVKLLDFGLARVYAPEAVSGGAQNLSQSPTVAYAGTMAGIVLGTAAYMSPEQARGKPVDRRADIWAFGVVLFEMLSGEKLFQGETVSDTLAAVLRQEVRWEALPRTIPGGIRELLGRCLERDPRKRLRDIGDARIAIEESERPGVVQAARAGAPALRPRAAWIELAALGVMLALGFAAGWVSRRPADSGAGPGSRWTLAIPDGLTLSTAEYPQIALSEDGRTQVVVVVDGNATSRLLVRRSDAFEARLLDDSERAVSPFLSPDGAWIGFFRDNALHKIPIAGGPPIRLATTSGQVRGGTWGRDGFIYFTPDTNVPLSRVHESGGEAETVTSLDAARDERTHRWPQALPGGAVLFTSDSQGSTEYYDDARIEAVRPGSGERAVLVEGSSQAWYAPGGQLLFARGGSIYSVAFDPGSLKLRGAPVLAVQGVATDVGAGAVQFAVSGSGAALWTPGGTTASYQILWVDRENVETRLSIPPAPYNELALSPDGKRLALVGGQGGVSDLWVADLERGALTRLTFGEFVTGPVWSPDGTRIAYGTRPQGRSDNLWQIVWKPADGSRDAELLFEGQRSHYPTSFAPDGSALVYYAANAQATAQDIWMLPLTPSVGQARKPSLLLGGPFRKAEAVISPDGRWMAYVSYEGGRESVFVRPFPAGDGRWQISTPNGIEPRWSRDGRELYYRVDAVLYRVSVEASRGFVAGRPERLFDRVASGSSVHTYAPDPAGAKFVTFRSPEGEGSLRTLYLDLGFGHRLGELTSSR